METGQKIGGYEVVARLKAGGMATLYLARRDGAAGFARHVAIKVVHPHLAHDDTFVKMFVDEAKLSARIEHPNVVHVEELGEDAGRYFIVMEYVHGCSLAQLERALAKLQRRLSIDLAVLLAMKVAEGLHAAHEATSDDGEPLGVVHRDVSPQNVLLAYKGYVKLIDFGIAKARGRAQETATRTLKGKLRYMAPEQAFGRRVDRRTDVYALGIVLWELLTMRKLFDGDDDFALLEKVRNPRVPPPSKYAPDVAPALDAAVLWALSATPDDRPPTAQAFRARLAEAAPSASSIGAEQLAELLTAVMSDEIERERQVLPESVSRLVRDAPSTADEPGRMQTDVAEALEALEALTVSTQGFAINVAEPDDGPGDASARDDESPPAGVDASIVERAVAPASSRAHLWIAGATVLALGIGGGAFALGAQTGAGAGAGATGAASSSGATPVASVPGNAPIEPSVPSPPAMPPDSGPRDEPLDAGPWRDAGGGAEPRGGVPSDAPARVRVRPPHVRRRGGHTGEQTGVPLISEPSW